MACVYQAYDNHLHTDVVIKVPHGDMLEDPLFVSLFASEIRSLVALAHPHIVTILDVDEHQGIPFAVMQYLSGGSLRDRRGQALTSPPGVPPPPMPPEELTQWLPDVAAALDFVHHRGYVHRDVKPENILFDTNGFAYLSDFGIAKVLFASGATQGIERTQAGAMRGTPRYMAPEVVRGESYSGSVDQFALALTVWELLSGRIPYDGPTPEAILSLRLVRDLPRLHDIVPGLSPVLGEIVQRGLARNPMHRYPDCRSFSQAVLDILHVPAPAPAVSTRPPAVEDDRDRLTTDLPLVPALDDLETIVPVARVIPTVPMGHLSMDVPSGKVIGSSFFSPSRVVFGVALLLLAAVAGGILVLTSWSDKGLPPPPPGFTNSVGMKMILIKPGEFLMGSAANDPFVGKNEQPQHTVRLNRAYYLGTHEVTVGQFSAFVAAKGYRTEAEKNKETGRFDLKNCKFVPDPDCCWKNPGWPGGQTPDHPVVNVTWNDANAFCAWLSEKESRTYTLPTEAEWEYACRAGSRTQFSCGDEVAGLRGVANLADASLRARIEKPDKPGFEDWNDKYPFTAPVGQFEPNHFGLCDMHGNVAEWCSDYYDEEYYLKDLMTDPQGPAFGKRGCRVARGGSWYHRASLATSPSRLSVVADTSRPWLGFRVVCRPASPPR
jgi:serine/threonine-protein kinase